MYSQVPNNRRGWDNKGQEWAVWKNSVDSFLVLCVKLNATLFYLFFQQMGTYSP